MTEQKPAAECFCQQLVRPLEKQRMWCGVVTGDEKNIHDESTGVDPHMFMISCPPTHAILCIIFPFTSPYKSFVSLYISLFFLSIYIYTSFDSILDTTTSKISFHLSSKSYSSHFICRCPTPKKWEDRKIMWIHWDMMDKRVRHLSHLRWSTLVTTLGDQSTRYTLWSINLLTLKLSNL